MIVGRSRMDRNAAADDRIIISPRHGQNHSARHSRHYRSRVMRVGMIESIQENQATACIIVYKQSSTFLPDLRLLQLQLDVYRSSTEMMQSHLLRTSRNPQLRRVVARRRTTLPSGSAGAETTTTPSSYRRPLSSSSSAAAADTDNTTTTTTYQWQHPKAQALFDKITAVLHTEPQVRALQRQVYASLGRPLREAEWFYDGFGTAKGKGGKAGASETGETPKAEEKQTAFDVKLVGFDPKAKIKVIKEIRSLAGLGLKEAKELVESAPTVVQKSLSTEAAEEVKAKLVELGAEVELV